MLCARARKRLAEHPTKGVLKRFPPPPNVLEESRIDKGLIVAPAGCMDLRFEPGKDGIIEPNGDARLRGRKGINRSTLGSAEIVFALHNCSSYCCLSCGVALRAEMIRSLLPRRV